VSRIPERQALQPERTALAWQRTALTSTMVFLPLLLVAVRLDVWWLLGAGSVLAMLSALSLLAVRQRFEELRDDTRGYSPFPLMLRVMAATVLGAVAGVATAVYAVVAWRS
jgi:uncharacterized membrane protein YidH (DUF202 family)